MVGHVSRYVSLIKIFAENVERRELRDGFRLEYMMPDNKMSVDGVTRR